MRLKNAIPFVAIEMDSTQHETAAHIRLDQDAHSSQHWRQEERIFHPLTQQEVANFRVGDNVTVQLLDESSNQYINATTVNIIQYDTVKQVLGSYNIDDTFNGAPFTHVLVLKP